ncbi:hypothetical protein LCI18_003046 [Fusarium solani-melongenae]|uniref:Uncharacterized protein n=1 Tax=Fusarium solani subsp. cucurbitae TaxID=2747967 RepID=A0ACD3YT34_FUSSC|nr:hypothetical protein LCI18_003046 [Fusarium solani-melongenae]
MSSEIAQIEEKVSANGFWARDDAQIGGMVNSIVRDGFRVRSREGWSLCEAAALKNELISGVIASFFPRSTFAFLRIFGRTRLKHCMMNRIGDDVRSLMVLCLSSESSVTIYSGSHLCQLEATDAPNGLLAIPDVILDQSSIQPEVVTMDCGGLAIMDARCGWQIGRGTCVFLGFVIPDEVKHWAPMPFPVTLKDIINATTERDGKIAINAKFTIN